MKNKIIAGIILAAGGSERMGVPKQLLDWNGEPMIYAVIKKALACDLTPVVVVLGAYTREINRMICHFPIHIINNPEWKSGLSSSVQAGLNGLSPEIDAVMFLAADQPQLPEKIITSLISACNTTRKLIVAPLVDGRKMNPVIVDKQLLPEIQKITGNIGGRELLDHFPVKWVKFKESNLFDDIDTLDQYIRLHESK